MNDGEINLFLVSFAKKLFLEQRIKPQTQIFFWFFCPMDAQQKRAQLNDEQQCVLEHFRRGENIFLTGPAGTGKTLVLGAIIEDARARG